MAEHNCPISATATNCPYPGPLKASKGQCNSACVDSWDGDHCYVRVLDQWVWTSDEPDETPALTVPFVANVRPPYPPGPRPGAKPVGKKKRRRR